MFRKIDSMPVWAFVLLCGVLIAFGVLVKVGPVTGLVALAMATVASLVVRARGQS